MANASVRRKTKGKIDYYPTPPHVTEALMEYLSGWYDLKVHTCYEPAAGGGHMSDVLKNYFRFVHETDIIDHENRGIKILDYLDVEPAECSVDWVITNPPFIHAADFALRGIRQSRRGCAMFCRTTFLESQTRWNNLFSRHKPSIVMPFVKRVNLVEGKISTSGGSAVSYSWFVWEHEKVGDTRLQWII